MTTHSPYVLATLNNLLKASMVGSVERTREAVGQIVSDRAWLNPAEIRAYAIEDRQVKDIRDRSGLIDASYLDGISNEINETFMRLLEIEVEND